jgi:hypothetical protein
MIASGLRASAVSMFTTCSGIGAVGLHIDHLAVGLDLRAGVLEALLHGLPERVGDAGMPP